MKKIIVILALCFLVTGCQMLQQTSHQKQTTIEDDYAYGVETTWIDEETKTEPTDQAEQATLLVIMGLVIAAGLGL